MGYISTWMGDRFSTLPMSLMALQITLVGQNPFWPCYSLQMCHVGVACILRKFFKRCSIFTVTASSRKHNSVHIFIGIERFLVLKFRSENNDERTVKLDNK